MEKYQDLTIEQIVALATEKRQAFDALVALSAPTVAQVEEAEALGTEIEEIEAAAASMRSKSAALRTRFAKKSDNDGKTTDQAPDGDSAGEARTIADAEEVRKADVPGDPTHEETVADEQGEVVPPGHVAGESEGQKGEKATAKGVATLAARTSRPATPATLGTKPVAITAAAEVPGYAGGQNLGTLEDVAKAVINRARGFVPPVGDGQSVDLRQFGTAMFSLDFPEDLIVDRPEDAQEVIKRATDERRLPGGALTAAGGWCAPSETVYDLTNDASTDGMLSLPEIAVRRGGIRMATSPVFADFYANPGFIQTEAQAIAGTTKPCIEVSCPSFVDTRLDAEGICIKVPILTNVGYPEVVSNFISGSLVAHQHWINANVIQRLVTFAGTARVATGIGSTAADTLGVLELLADQKRQTYRLPMEASLEVVLPFWVEGAVRSDLEVRTGQLNPVSDQQINSYFANRGLNVQYVYDWQLLPTVDVAGTAGTDEAMTYPTTFQALMYPAGTFVKGTADIINLNTVYDAASLAVNVYTGLFVEQGLLVAKAKNYQADLVTLPVCSAGRTGANDLTCTAANWA